MLINVCDEQGRTALHYAARSPSSCSFTKLNEALLACRGGGANVNARDADGYTPLLTAVQHHQYDPNLGVDDFLGGLRALFNHGADVTATTSTGKTVLHLMSDRETPAPVSLLNALIAHGAEACVSMPSAAYGTPWDYAWATSIFPALHLHPLVMSQRKNWLRWLGDTDLGTACGETTATETAVIVVVMELVYEYAFGFIGGPILPDAFREAILRGDAYTVQRALTQQPPLFTANDPLPGVCLPLHVAAAAPDCAPLTALLAHAHFTPADINRVSELYAPRHCGCCGGSGITAVHLTVQRAKHSHDWQSALAKLEMLAARGAAFDAVTPDGHTVMHLVAGGIRQEAPEAPKIAVLDYLIAHGGAYVPGAVDQKGATALQVAVKNENVELVRCLVQKAQEFQTDLSARLKASLEAVLVRDLVHVVAAYLLDARESVMPEVTITPPLDSDDDNDGDHGIESCSNP